MARALSVDFPDTRSTPKWIVQRAGSPGHWLPGWFALGPDGRGAWFPTHAEALDLALRSVARDVSDTTLTDALARWGIARLEQSAPRRRGGRPPALTAEQARTLRRERADGTSVAELAKQYGLSVKTVYAYLRRSDADQ